MWIVSQQIVETVFLPKSYPRMMRSVGVRLYLMSVLLALLTAIAVIVIAYFLEFKPAPEFTMASLIVAWQHPESCNCKAQDFERGYIIGPDERVSYVWGDLPCSAGDAAEACSHTENTVQELRQPLRDGSVAVAQIARPPFSFWFGDFLATLWRYVRWVIIIAVPLSLLLSFLVVAPLLRRLQRIANTSRAVASGNLEARTFETRFDEVGQLGQQFDRMAETISHQVKELRESAKQNSMLALAAERNARAAERLALSRDLHDSISQHLFSLAMGTNDLASLIRRDPKKAALQAEQLSGMAAQAQDDLREVLSQLRSEKMGQGLLESLSDFINLWSKRYGVPVNFQMQHHETLPIVVENVLYRVCQEALNNVARHAEAKQVDVTLKLEDSTVYLQISDDGRGFDVSADNVGFGLLGMRERVRAIGGRLELSSSSSGTTLKVLVPVGSMVTA
jgi:two-component system, NarL family, sensor histidine kinase LiaS